MPELRKDPVVGRWVIISTDRGRRPSDFGQAEGAAVVNDQPAGKKEETKKDPLSDCCNPNSHSTGNSILEIFYRG